MNRRNFINNLLIAGASFTILPGAGRLWRVSRKEVELFVDMDYSITTLDKGQTALIKCMYEPIYEEFARYISKHGTWPTAVEVKWRRVHT